MILGIATEGNNICSHFGHAPFFTIADIQNGKIANLDKKPNPGHSPGALPKWMKELGIELVISGGMGPRAQDLFENLGIHTLVVHPTTVEEFLASYLEGNVKTGPSACHHVNGE